MPHHVIGREQNRQPQNLFHREPLIELEFDLRRGVRKHGDPISRKTNRDWAVPAREGSLRVERKAKREYLRDTHSIPNSKYKVTVRANKLPECLGNFVEVRLA